MRWCVVAVVALGLLLAPTARGSFPSTWATLAIGRYPGFSGTQAAGSVHLAYKSSQGTFTLTGQVTGLDPACETAACGVHVHEGYTCDSASEVQGHFWVTGTSDVWANVHYTTDSAGTWATGVVVASDLTMADVAGHALVFHSSTGERIACGLIRVDPSEFPSQRYAWGVMRTYPDTGVDRTGATTGFAPYPGYSGALQVAGSVQVTYGTGLAFAYSYSFTGLEPSATGGVHVHAGKTCATAGDIGGHYYTGDTDPWNSTYTSDAAGAATGSFELADGYYLPHHADHAVVVHAADGTRVACAILRFTPVTRGYVVVSETDNTLSLYLSASGLEGSQPVVTGSFHVHSGELCEFAGGHLLHGNGEDPWGASQAYTVDDDQLVNQGKARTVADATAAGFSLNDVVGKTVVIHASDGTRIACAELHEESSPSRTPTVTPSISLSPSNTPTISVTASSTSSASRSPSASPSLSVSAPADDDGGSDNKVLVPVLGVVIGAVAVVLACVGVMRARRSSNPMRATIQPQ